ncbi:unnamed protein product [Phaedon cochleariae]|uniref:VPS9 domain-containing protein n=1 Tax=Phaedon cochleariae TaxID=80249 RepID=A0A9P0DED7_PHACE|nr:unnamed protein product [Phaedon cochleariae]
MNVDEQNEYFTSKSRVGNYLAEISGKENIIEEIENTICSWSFTSDIDLQAINVDIGDVIKAVREKFFGNNDDLGIYEGIHRVVHNFVWENVMPLVHAHFNEEDSEYHRISKYFCSMRTKPGQMLHNFSSVPFTAAVVELSMLDSYKSPSEKLNCLCTTYDLLFAEVKSALVTLISEYSDRELEIPMINNEEVVPILMDVLIKSKLLHPCSNLFYMKLFGAKILQQDQQKRSILRSFETVINEMRNLRKNESMNGSADHDMGGDLLHMNNDIDFCQIMTISLAEDESQPQKNATLTAEQKRRLVSLVMLSTSENDYVTTNVPKIFMK